MGWFNLLLRCLCFGVLFFLNNGANAQVSGCRDPQANNYNPAATVNDGSCTYNTTSYTPPFKAFISNTLQETSGLQWADNALWSFNDGGATATIYRIDTAFNNILQTVHIDGATNIDWEDIAFDGTHFYIGDFGNNANGARTDLKIYKFPLSAIPSDYVANPIVNVPAGQVEVISFIYADQPQPPTPVIANSTAFDCEAMFVDAGGIHLFSKNWQTLNTTHYLINGLTAGSYTATAVETLGTGYLVTAADKVPGSAIAVLLGYQATGFGNHFMHLLTDFSGGLYFNGNKRLLNLPTAATMGQAEGITFRNSTYGYISNERLVSFITIDQQLRRFITTGFTPSYVLPLELLSFHAVNKNGQHRISWRFAAAVRRLKLLRSTDGRVFTEVHAEATTTAGAINLPAPGGKLAYQLQWEVAGGGPKRSRIVWVGGTGTKGISQPVLQRSGSLSFVADNDGALLCRFRLLAPDGRVLATRQQQVFAGINHVQFDAFLTSQSTVLLQVVFPTTQQTVALAVH